MRYTNAQGLPGAFIRALERDRYSEDFKAWLIREGLESQPLVISVTALNDSARFYELKRRYGHEFVMEASRGLAALRGRLIHKLLEESGLEEGETLVEERIYFWAQSRSGRRWAVTGAPDSVAILGPGGTLSDWKTTKAWAVMPGARKLASWEAQVNLYAAMVEVKMALPFGYLRRLEIVPWILDWSESTAAKSKDYPQAEVTKIEVPRWDEVKTHRHLLDRLAAHEVARFGSELPECSEEERWQTVEGWAVTGRGNCRATKVFSSVLEAEEFRDAKAPKIYDITQRLSEPRRCLRWCPALPFCPQGRALVAPKAREAEPEETGLEAALKASLAQLKERRKREP